MNDKFFCILYDNKSIVIRNLENKKKLENIVDFCDEERHQNQAHTAHRRHEPPRPPQLQKRNHRRRLAFEQDYSETSGSFD